MSMLKRDNLAQKLPCAFYCRLAKKKVTKILQEDSRAEILGLTSGSIQLEVTVLPKAFEVKRN